MNPNNLNLNLSISLDIFSRISVKDYLVILFIDLYQTFFLKNYPYIFFGITSEVPSRILPDITSKIGNTSRNYPAFI